MSALPDHWAGAGPAAGAAAGVPVAADFAAASGDAPGAFATYDSVGRDAAAGVAVVGAAAAALPVAFGDGTSAPSAIASTVPWLTLSPTLTFSSLITPAPDDGISIDALSLSIVISDWSAATVSPTFTSTSITSTSLKSPMSGTLSSIDALIAAPDACRPAPRRDRS